MEYNKKDLYVIIMWPDSQALMDEEGFEDNCYLANCEPFGGGAYFVNVNWLEHINN